MVFVPGRVAAVKLVEHAAGAIDIEHADCPECGASFDPRTLYDGRMPSKPRRLRPYCSKRCSRRAGRRRMPTDAAQAFPEHVTVGLGGVVHRASPPDEVGLRRTLCGRSGRFMALDGNGWAPLVGSLPGCQVCQRRAATVRP